MPTGGHALIALPATAKGGTISKVTVELSGLVDTARSEVDVVVTESVPPSSKAGPWPSVPPPDRHRPSRFPRELAAKSVSFSREAF